MAEDLGLDAGRMRDSLVGMGLAEVDEERDSPKPGTEVHTREVAAVQEDWGGSGRHTPHDSCHDGSAHM